MRKKALKVAATSSALTLKICYYGFPYVQGQLSKVSLNFDIFAIKVVGQTIYSRYTTKLSNLQSNGCPILGLIKFSISYQSYITTPAFMVKSEQVPEVQFHNIGGQ